MKAPSRPIIVVVICVTVMYSYLFGEVAAGHGGAEAMSQNYAVVPTGKYKPALTAPPCYPSYHSKT